MERQASIRTVGGVLTVLITFSAAAWGLVVFLERRDEALPQARTVASRSAEVLSLVGDDATGSVVKFVHYHGVPGKEDPYREYLVRVNGSRGKARVTVRATRPEPTGEWKYEIRSIEQIH